MKAVVAVFNQEKALVGAFSVIVQLHQLTDLQHYLISSPAPTPIKIICSHNEEWDYLINLINGMDYGWVGTFTIRSASLPCYYYYQLLTIYILHIFMQIYYHTHTHHIILSHHCIISSCQIILPISDMGWPSTELWTAGMMDDGFMCCLPCQLYK